MTSKDRILKTLKGESVDRIPILPGVSCHRVVNQENMPVIVGYLGKKFRSTWLTQDPNFLEIVELVKRECDILRRYEFPEFDRRFFLIPKEYVKVARIKKERRDEFISYQLQTPKGDLKYVVSKERNISTVWDRKHLIQNKEDVEKILSVRYTFQKPNIQEFFRYQKSVEAMGGIMEIWISTPMVCVSQLLPFETFLTWSLTEKATIIRLIEVVFERIYSQLEYLLEKGVGPIYHFGGSEQATPPMMSPKLFDEFVVKYDSQLFDLVHKHDCYVAVHCHGRINNVFERIIDMGVDLLEPVEGPPSGDIDIDDAKRRAKGKMVLMGNIQFRDLELCTPQEIERKVKQVICSGGKEKFILGATDEPIVSVSNRLKENYIQMIKSGLTYGRF